MNEIANANGVLLRPTRGREDWARMVDVMNAANQADGLQEEVVLAEKENDYAHLHNCNPALDELCIEVNGMLMAFGGIEWRDDNEGNRLYQQTVMVHPDVRHLGLRQVLLEFNEARARVYAAEHPIQPKWMSLWVNDTADVATQRLLTGLGYAPARYFFEMLKPLTVPYVAPLPAGLEWREAEPHQLRDIWNAKEEAFADHWGHGVRGETEFQLWVNDPIRDHALWAVAWDTHTNKIAGVSINFIFHADNAAFGFRRGWIGSLGVRRPYRGRGLAKALLAHSFIKLQQAGMTEAVLGVDADNPTGALQLYTGVGFAQHKQSAIWRKRIA